MRKADTLSQHAAARRNGASTHLNTTDVDAEGVVESELEGEGASDGETVADGVLEPEADADALQTHASWQRKVTACLSTLQE